MAINQHEGALTNEQLDEAVRSGEPTFMLGIYHDQQIKNPSEIEQDFPTWFSAPRFAKKAGAAFAETHPQISGYEVTKVTRGGHYRTAAQVWL